MVSYTEYLVHSCPFEFIDPPLNAKCFTSPILRIAPCRIVFEITVCFVSNCLIYYRRIIVILYQNKSQLQLNNRPSVGIPRYFPYNQL